MTSLTIAVDDEILRQAQDRASAQGTSVDVLLREYVEELAGVAGTYREAVHSLIHRSRRVDSRRGARTWTRDELHERDV